MTNFLSVRQLAAHFGISIPTVRRWLADGSLRCTRIGGAVRFSPENIAQFIAESEAKCNARHDAALPANQQVTA
jgi:excisionase family DNA binding protein